LIFDFCHAGLLKVKGGVRVRPNVSGFTREVTNLDLFAGFNALLFLLMCVFVYHQRFIAFRGAVNLHEFFLYAASILGAIFLAWICFRTLRMSSTVLMLIQAGILLHFAGGLIEIDGTRLYDHFFLGVRYDKYVHLANSFVGMFATTEVFRKIDISISGLVLLIAVFVVLGVGAIIEILEYVVSLTVANHGVGNYANNMQDLIANLLGSILAVGVMLVCRASNIPAFAWNPPLPNDDL